MAVCWLLLGTSLVVTIHAVVDKPPAWDVASWASFAACMAVGYVGGFVIFWIPSAVGVREQFLKVLLAPQLVGLLGVAESNAVPLAVLIAIILRLVWTTAELLMAGVVYWLPGPRRKEIAKCKLQNAN
jgi:hypothetical protein